MKLIVQQVRPGVFVKYDGGPVRKTLKTARVVHADPTKDYDAEVEPYEIVVRPSTVESWSANELAEHGLYEARSYEPSAGMVPIGDPQYLMRSDNYVYEVYEEQPAPPPPPPKTPAQTLEIVTGLTIEQIKEALGLTDTRTPRAPK